MSYFQLVQRITVAELLACPSCQSLVSDKRTSAISNAVQLTLLDEGGKCIDYCHLRNRSPLKAERIDSSIRN